MVECLLCMQEVLGSIPRFSMFCILPEQFFNALLKYIIITIYYSLFFMETIYYGMTLSTEKANCSQAIDQWREYHVISTDRCTATTAVCQYFGWSRSGHQLCK